jgi:hypothetical protein
VLQLAAAAAAVAGIILLGRSPVAGRARSHDAGERRPAARGPDGRPPQAAAITPQPSAITPKAAGTGRHQDMTGSPRAAVIMPIVAVILLTAWIAIVSCADAQPTAGKSGDESAGADNGGGRQAARRLRPSRAPRPEPAPGRLHRICMVASPGVRGGRGVLAATARERRRTTVAMSDLDHPDGETGLCHGRVCR